MNDKKGMLALSAVLAALVFTGAAMLGEAWRTSANYPEYSSLNDSPFGVSALYRTLGESRKTSRLYDVYDKIPPENTTLLQLGTWIPFDGEPAKKSREREFAEAGGRLVQAASDHTNRLSKISERTTNVWTTVHSAAGVPLIIERKLGAGTHVICSQSAFLSNEALANRRRTDLILRVIGDSRNVVFDETVRGVVERRNVAWLLRRHGLFGIVGVFLCVAALALWRGLCPMLERGKSKRLPAADEPSPAERESPLAQLLRSQLTPAQAREQLRKIKHDKP